MRTRLAVIGLLALVTTVASADEWYSIDGFFLRTGEEIWIDAPIGGESHVIEFLFGAGLRPAVRGYLVGPDEGLSGVTQVARTALAAVDRMTSSAESIVSYKETPDPKVRPGSWRITIETSANTWHAARVALESTPGGLYSELLLISMTPDHPPHALRRLLEEIEIDIADAAG